MLNPYRVIGEFLYITVPQRYNYYNRPPFDVEVVTDAAMLATLEGKGWLNVNTNGYPSLGGTPIHWHAYPLRQQLVVHHKNEDKLDARRQNLDLITTLENTRLAMGLPGIPTEPVVYQNPVSKLYMISVPTPRYLGWPGGRYIKYFKRRDIAEAAWRIWLKHFTARRAQLLAIEGATQ